MSDVLIKIAGACGRMTLNRPQAINALTSEMVHRIAESLAAWAHAPSVHFVLIDGAGERGLCAGGDIRAVYTAIRAGRHELAAAFFRDEYRLNHQIAHYPKPCVVLMDGVVMGGGIGLSGHASHRIVTERARLAMPETSLGFITDVGGTYLLGIAPGELGTYLALTGARIGPADAIALGLADRMVLSSSLPRLTDDLERCTDIPAVEACLTRYTAPPPPGALLEQTPWVQECFAEPTVEQILAALRRRRSPETSIAADLLQTMSPTSLKVTLAAIRLARISRDLAASLRQEYRIACACLHQPDFPEGIRAALIDRDHNPAWSPARLDEVTSDTIESYFAAPASGDLNLA